MFKGKCPLNNEVHGWFSSIISIYPRTQQQSPSGLLPRLHPGISRSILSNMSQPRCCVGISTTSWPTAKLRCNSQGLIYQKSWPFVPTEILKWRKETSKNLTIDLTDLPSISWTPQKNQKSYILKDPKLPEKKTWSFRKLQPLPTGKNHGFSMPGMTSRSYRVSGTSMKM